MSKVAVIGGGPSGMMAAAEAAKCGHNTILFEKNDKLGKKLFLTGKGRCNITNDAAEEEFFENFARNKKFMYSALYGFNNRDIVEIIEKMGVPTKVERGGRIFPESDKSSDVLRALSKYTRECGAQVCLDAQIKSIEKCREGGFNVVIQDQTHHFDNVIIATGGASYSSTGSTGDGYEFARKLGHSVTDIRPSLIPLETVEEWPKALMGLSLRNVKLTAKRNGKSVYNELGEMLFTHFGVSGPLVLSASAHIADAPEGVKLNVDLKPGLDSEELNRRVLRDFDKNVRKTFRNSLDELLPQKIIPVVIELSGIPYDTPVHQITKEMRIEFCHLLKNITMTVKCALPLDQAIITRGGISVKEINASTMESKIVKGLYFAGEVIDVDAYTGGFNLQIAYSTGVLAGKSIQ